jgi:hypothetical protein
LGSADRTVLANEQVIDFGVSGGSPVEIASWSNVLQDHRHAETLLGIWRG